MTTNLSLLRLLLFSAVLIFQTRAGLVPLDNFNLVPYEFTYNFPFVFSDRTSETEDLPLKNAYARVDLKVKMLGKNVTGDHRLFLVIGEREYLKEVGYEIEAERLAGRFRDAKDIEKILNVYGKHLPIYGTLTLSERE